MDESLTSNLVRIDLDSRLQIRGSDINLVQHMGDFAYGSEGAHVLHAAEMVKASSCSTVEPASQVS